MLNYYGDTKGVPEYIYTIEDAQKKAQQVQLTIPNVTLVAIATKSILQDQDFTLEMKEWEKNLPVNKTCLQWKYT